jgi:thiol-disulfide isomerase/thioredoxin
MEKWKIIVIVLLLGGLLGYGVYQQTPRPPVPVNTPTSTPTPSAPVVPAGQPLPITWDIPASYWANTPQPIKPQDLKGSVTLIEFWRSGCPHCEEAAPFMEKLYQEYSPLGLKMVTFQSPGRGSGPDSEEGNWQRVQDTIKKWGITYPVAFDQGAQLFTRLHGERYPTIIVLNRQGLVEYSDTGHTPEKARALTVQLEALFKNGKQATPHAS